MGNRDFAQHSERPPHDESIRGNSTFVKSTIADSIKDEVRVGVFSADRIPTIIRHVSNSDTCLHPEGTVKKPDAGSVFVRGHYSTIRVVIHTVANHTPVPDQADLEVLALFFLEHFRQCLVVDHPAMQHFFAVCLQVYLYGGKCSLHASRE